MDFPITKIENVEGSNLKTFTSTTQIGLPDYNCTLTDIVNALPLDSQLIIRASKWSHPNLDLPAYNCQLIITRTTGDFVEFLCSSPYTNENAGRFWRGIWFKDTNPQWSGWKQLATNGASSMPSTTAINVSVSFTANSSTFNSFGTLYTAPADGWFKIAIQFTVGKYGQAAIWVVDSDIAVTAFAETNSVDTERNIYLPVAKGQVLGGNYKQISTIVNCKFIYAQSEV